MTKRTNWVAWGLVTAFLAGGLLGVTARIALAAHGQSEAPDAAALQAALQAAVAPPHALWLESLDLTRITQGFGRPQAGRSVDGNPLTLGGVVYPHGIGTLSRGRMEVDLKGAAIRFAAMVGVDDERKGSGSVMFQVWVDGRLRVRTGVLQGGDPPQLLSADLTGAQRLSLIVEHGDDEDIPDDHADWAGAFLTLVPDTTVRPETVAPPREWPRAPATPAEPPPPIASGVSPQPALHGPRVVGATPGRPFLFLIPATGTGPLTFSARHLPAGLRLDRQTGIISGALRRPGATVVELQVRGPRGRARRQLTIVVGDHLLALTPPMGWNSWNVWATWLNEGRVQDAADWLVRSGLAAHGYQYVNIDLGWQDFGGAAGGEIRPNGRFHDLPALADYVHRKGLKLGIYTGPSWTFGHERQYAETFARWGVDYLKLDGGLSRRSDPQPEGDKMPYWERVDSLKEEYRKLRAALDSTSRDIVFSHANMGFGKPWEWGAEAGGNLWRTSRDMSDMWVTLRENGFRLDGKERYAGPGHWNDPDMLVVGVVGWGVPRRTRLTPNEQITHITLWSLLAAPLLLGCDLSRLDPWTTALLTNDEVIDVDQDPLGRPAGRRSFDGWGEVWARPLWDGTTTAGLFNLGPERATVTARWSDLGLTGRLPVHDLWQQKDLGAFDGMYSAEVPAHGAVLLKIGHPKAAS